MLQVSAKAAVDAGLLALAAPRPTAKGFWPGGTRGCASPEQYAAPGPVLHEFTVPVSQGLDLSQRCLEWQPNRRAAVLAAYGGSDSARNRKTRHHWKH